MYAFFYQFLDDPLPGLLVEVLPPVLVRRQQVVLLDVEVLLVNGGGN